MEDIWSDKGAVCPKCKHVMRPQDEHYALYSEDTCEYECSSCETEFNVMVFTRYSWTTSLPDED